MFYLISNITFHLYQVSFWLLLFWIPVDFSMALVFQNITGTAAEPTLGERRCVHMCLHVCVSVHVHLCVCVV